MPGIGEMGEGAIAFLKRNKAAVIAIILLLGVVLRALFINQTDVTSDEAFYIKFAYKIAFLGWQAPWAILAGLAAFVALFWAIALKKSLKVTAGFAVGLLALKYALGMGYLTHAPNPFFILATSLVIFLTNALPNVAGEVVSSVAAIVLAFIAYKICSKQWGERTGIIAFALVMLSPLSLFMSGTSLLGLAGMALFYGSILVFLRAMKNHELLPLSGFLFALAIAARYASLIGVPFFLYLLWSNRAALKERAARKNAAIFLILMFALAAFYSPLIVKEFVSPIHWHEGTLRNNMFEAHYSAFLADATGGQAHLYGDNLFVVNAMAQFYSPAFLLLLAAAVGFAFIYLVRNNDKPLLVFLLIFLLLFFFFAFFIKDKRVNYLVEFELPAMLLAAFFLGNAKLGLRKVRTAVAVLFVAFFLFQSAVVLQEHHFRGMSGLMDRMPEDAVLYVTAGGQKDQAHYYRGTYLFDTQVNRAFFQGIFPVDEEKAALFAERDARVRTELEDASQIDYALVDSSVKEGDAEISALQGFVECETVKSGQYLVFRVLARESALCQALN